VIKSKNDNSPKLICFSGGLSVDSTKRADSFDSYQPAATKKVNFLSQNQLKKPHTNNADRPPTNIIYTLKPLYK